MKRELERGRALYRARDWVEALEMFSRADQGQPLSPGDLERSALAAYLSGDRDRYGHYLGRAYGQYSANDEARKAARTAFWLGFESFSRGESTVGSVWLGRAERSLEAEGDDCVERGYLLLPRIPSHLSTGRFEEALSIAVQVADFASRYGDMDLETFSLHGQGIAVLKQGEVERGLRLLDEAMVGATGDDVHPVIAGVVYCSAISACRQVLDLKRMKQWTALLSEWCARQAGLVPYLGECKVFRSELLQMEGAWSEALTEAEEAVELGRSAENPRVVGLGWYQVGELRRLRGEYRRAETAYLQAHQQGRDPQPGLAELWLRQGKADTAASALRRALEEGVEPQLRIRLLPAYIRSLIELDDHTAAADSCQELTALAQGLGQAVPETSPSDRVSLAESIARECSGRMALAVGEPKKALVLLREACGGFQQLGAPYETARVRMAIGRACEELGDAETSAMEYAAARNGLQRLADRADLKRMDRLLQDFEPSHSSPLSNREVQVVALVAAGLTNRAIGQKLGLSVKTVDRHMSNIFDKLDVASRAAAAARATELKLL